MLSTRPMTFAPRCSSTSVTRPVAPGGLAPPRHTPVTSVVTSVAWIQSGRAAQPRLASSSAARSKAASRRRETRFRKAGRVCLPTVCEVVRPTTVRSRLLLAVRLTSRDGRLAPAQEQPGSVAGVADPAQRAGHLVAADRRLALDGPEGLGEP